LLSLYHCDQSVDREPVHLHGLGVVQLDQRGLGGLGTKRVVLLLLLRRRRKVQVSVRLLLLLLVRRRDHVVAEDCKTPF